MKNKEYAMQQLADLWDYVSDSDYIERPYILEKIEEIQNFINNYL